MSARHPDQPLITDGKGTIRFKENHIVRYVLDNGGIDLNHLARQDFDQEDRQQFAQLIGYSLSGYGELSYVSDEAYERAAAQAAEPWTGEGPPPVGIECEVSTPHVDWLAVTIRYVGEERVITHDGDRERCWLINSCKFRLLRTPGQVAAETRVKAAQAWLKDIEQEYGQEVADKCEDILMQAESRKQVAP